MAKYKVVEVEDNLTNVRRIVVEAENEEDAKDEAEASVEGWESDYYGGEGGIKVTVERL